jgi:hypothetical protein
MDISSTFGADPDDPTGWQIETFGKVNQKVPAGEMRFLVHWGARLFKDMAELKKTYDHTDDINADTALNLLMNDMRARSVEFEIPSDPMNDRKFIGLLSQVYDIGGPGNIPADATGEEA